jgi:uncharacterized membrane protein YidH (DUF202 family)
VTAPPPALFDPGLQPERTELAWRRTCLALGVGSLIAMRVLPVAFGSALWVLGGVAGLVAAALLWVFARRRYRAGTDALHADGDRARMPDGRLILALASLVTVVAAVSLVLALAIATGAARTLLG